MNVLALLLQQDNGGLGWLFQLVAVFIFLVLPVLKSIAEAKKRKAEQSGKLAAPRAPAPRRAGGAQKEGRDMWRDLLEGRTEPREPERAKPAPPMIVRTPASPAQPAPMNVPMNVPMRVPRPVAFVRPPPPPPVVREVPLPRMPTAPPMESLESGVAAAMADKGSLASQELDPATLDDELIGRWDRELSGAQLRQAPAAFGAVDWRRAVLLSELLSPPLALRGHGSAWPGPPAALGN